MARNKLLAKMVLLPMSKLFGIGVAVRNSLFERGLKKQVEVSKPVVVVGNLAVGGTGKTPHVEYIIESLHNRYHAAVLSRGYKRKTSGFVLASPHTSPDDIGDEAFQIHQKYGNDVAVAVCENRVEGTQRLLDIDNDINLFVLDDAFQHRQIKPTVSIVLTEFHRPAFSDSMLPYGRLREPISALGRADIVVVTKCPSNIKSMECRIFKEKLNLFPFQKLYFSRYVYGQLVPVFPEKALTVPFLDRLTDNDSILVVTGVANPRPFVRYLRHYKAKVRLLCFPDHHKFTPSDILAIDNKFHNMTGERKYVITTEKDAVRISHNPYYTHALRPVTYFLPVSVDFINAATPNEPPFEQALIKLIEQSTLYG